MRKLLTICALCLIMQGCTSMKVPDDLALGVLLIESDDDGLEPSYIVVAFPFQYTNTRITYEVCRISKSCR